MHLKTDGGLSEGLNLYKGEFRKFFDFSKVGLLINVLIILFSIILVFIFHYTFKTCVQSQSTGCLPLSKLYFVLKLKKISALKNCNPK